VWLNSEAWEFEQHEETLKAYTGRGLSFESDKLAALTGCLSVIAHKKNIRFLSGLPSKIFHYALLWRGEFDRPREGYPGWSWAEWHALQQLHLIYPHQGSSGQLKESKSNVYHLDDSEIEQVELQGLLLFRPERPDRPAKFRQNLAQISLNELTGCITVVSEYVIFFMHLYGLVEKCVKKYVPENFNLPSPGVDVSGIQKNSSNSLRTVFFCTSSNNAH
jgi:hypothetical protein